MTRRRAPGPDYWTSDIFKDLDFQNTQLLFELLEHWWEIEALPREAQRARIASIYKKGDPKLPQNYRPISLLSVFFKAFAAIVQRKLAAFIDHFLDDNLRLCSRLAPSPRRWLAWPSWLPGVRMGALVPLLHKPQTRRWAVRLFCNSSR
jgi:hypothetical protein